HPRLVERRAENGGMGDLAAEPAADAALVDVGHGVVAQWVRIVLERQRWATVEAHARLVARAHVGVHAEARRLDARARLELGGHLRLHAALALELALRARDDDLEPARRGGHRLLHHHERVFDSVGIHHFDPGHAEAL